MVNTPAIRPMGRLAQEITGALASLWTRHTGARPSDARTEIRGNVVTCVLTDAFDGDPGSDVATARVPTPGGTPEAAVAQYERDATAAVTRATRQRVRSLASGRDVESGRATETFVLEPSLGRGAPPRARTERAGS